MNGDTLSDLLRAVHLRGAVFYQIEGIPPWAAATPHAREIIPVIMPGADHMIEFHGLVGGTCWAAIRGGSPLRMEAGDVILFPHGDPHVLSSAPGMPAPSHDKDFFLGQLESPRPFALEGTEAHGNGQGNDRATVICGYLGLDARPFNPLLAALPQLLLIPGGALGPDSWVMTLMQAVVNESSGKQPGGQAVLERMSEMLFVEVLRRHIETLPEKQTGWFAGMRDPTVGRALSLMHGDPSLAWTLDSLCERTGLSRSSLHDRFVHYIGQAPMQYLTQWRMQVASGLLRESNAKVIEVAMSVGYESEAAFSRAFKRVAGLSPGEWRKIRRAHAEVVLEPVAG